MLTDPLKRIVRDLVDKKLWPVALLLVAAIVAVPMLIGGGSSTPAPAPAPVAVPAPTQAGSSKALVTSVDPSGGPKQTRPGRVTDPFYDPPDPPAEDSASGDSGSGAGAGGSGAGQASSGGGTPAGDTSSPTPRLTPPSQTTPRPASPVAAPVYYRTEVRWSETTPNKAHPLARLAPLGGLDDPAALFLGVTKSTGSYAVFLLGPNATSAGDAECETGTDCRVIGLKAGQSQTVTVQPPAGEARRYRLDVAAVKAVSTDAATARTMRAKVHADGRDVMRAMWQHAPIAAALGSISYNRDAGLLVKKPAAAPTVGDKVTG